MSIPISALYRPLSVHGVQQRERSQHDSDTACGLCGFLKYEGRFAVSSNVGEVNYKITEEVVRGQGCSGGFLGIPTGDRNFIPSGVDLGTREGRAQAAAIYDALYGNESGQLGTDIIVQPTFNINTSGVPLIAKQACATVVGYRGIVTGVN